MKRVSNVPDIDNYAVYNDRMRRSMWEYKYTENWERECAENYFSYTMEDLKALLDPDGRYKPILLHRYILPWCRYDAQNRLGVDMGDEIATHFSLILQRADAVSGVSLNQHSSRRTL